MLRLAFDFIITWRETRTRPNAYLSTICIMNKGVSHDTPLFFYVKTSVLKTKQEDLAYFFPYPGV